MTLDQKAKVQGALDMLKAIADAIKELEKVPSGELYARLMGHLSFSDYSKAIEILKGAGLIDEKNHELIWRAQS